MLSALGGEVWIEWLIVAFEEGTDAKELLLAFKLAKALVAGEYGTGLPVPGPVHNGTVVVPL